MKGTRKAIQTIREFNFALPVRIYINTKTNEVFARETIDSGVPSHKDFADENIFCIGHTDNLRDTSFIKMRDLGKFAQDQADKIKQFGFCDCVKLTTDLYWS